MSTPKLNYAVLYDFAYAHRLDYNELCAVVRAAFIEEEPDELRRLARKLEHLPKTLREFADALRAIQESEKVAKVEDKQ